MESHYRETDQSRTYEGHGSNVVFIAVLRLRTAIKKLYLFRWKKSRCDNARNMKNDCDQYTVSYINMEYTNMISPIWVDDMAYDRMIRNKKTCLGFKHYNSLASLKLRFLRHYRNFKTSHSSTNDRK